MRTKPYHRFTAKLCTTSLKLISISVMGAMFAMSGYAENSPTGTDSSNQPVAANERDQYSKPQEVFTFSGVDEGSVVVDVGAGSGYNTSRLLPLVGKTGKVYAAGGNPALAERIADGDLKGANNVVITEDAAGVPSGVVDVVLLIREFHLAPDHPKYLESTILKNIGIV